MVRSDWRLTESPPMVASGPIDWSATQYVMPRAMQLTLQGTFDKSPLLSEAPTLANGGLTQNPFSYPAGRAVPPRG